MASKVARETGFVKRNRNLDGDTFFKTMVWGFMDNPMSSLGQLCDLLYSDGVTITESGLNKRINEKSEAFFKEMLSHSLELCRQEKRKMGQIFDQFKGVYVQDSTLIKLPASLAEQWPGFKSKGTEAIMRVQLCFEFLKGQIELLEFESGQQNDQQYYNFIDQISSGALVIMDLGYFALKRLEAIAKKEAYFLIKWKFKTNIYQPTTGEQIDLRHLLRQQQTDLAEYDILLGTKHKIPCRLIAARVPQEVADRRRQTSRQNARKKGRTPPSHSLEYADWSLILTNTPETCLSPKEVLVAYSWRWQIELIFKMWKSSAQINRMAQFRRYRLFVELYAKMIGIVLTHFLFSPFQFYWIKSGKELSLTKARHILAKFALSFYKILGSDDPFSLISEFADRVRLFATKDKRRKKLNSWDKLLSANSLSLAQIFPFKEVTDA